MAQEKNIIPQMRLVEDGKLRTLQLRITVISNGLLFKPGNGTHFAKDMDEVRAMVSQCLDQMEEFLEGER